MTHTLSLLVVLFFSTAVSADYPWQESQARVLSNGDLAYTPRPFAFQPGDSQRYIDFENGDDSYPGTRDQPWKHHPWDPDATANAQAAATEVHTYVFRGGVTYRGHFEIPEGARGTADLPIRLTRDPGWGEGPAVISGAESVTGWTREAQALL